MQLASRRQQCIRGRRTHRPISILGSQERPARQPKPQKAVRIRCTSRTRYSLRRDRNHERHCRNAVAFACPIRNGVRRRLRTFRQSSQTAPAARGSRATWVNGQISPMISVQMLTLFLMFITSGKESARFRDTSGPQEARHTCRSQPRCMHLRRPQTRS